MPQPPRPGDREANRRSERGHSQHINVGSWSKKSPVNICLLRTCFLRIFKPLLFPPRSCPALLVVGDTSPAVEAVVSCNPSSQQLRSFWGKHLQLLVLFYFLPQWSLLLLFQVECNSRLNPTKTTLLKVNLSSLVQSI